MRSPRGRIESRPWASLLAGVVFVASVAAGSCAPEGQCPRTLDCARQGRHFCQPGSSHCGPCLSLLVENKRGKCVVRRRSYISKASSLPELDEEIDFLSSIITKQQSSEPKQAVLPSQVIPKHKWDSAAMKSAHRAMGHPTHATPARLITSGLTTATPATTTTTTTSTTTAHAPPNTPPPAMQSGPLIIPYPSKDHAFLITMFVCLMVGAVALILAGICWVRLRRGMLLAQKVDYPAFGVMGPHSYDNISSGDKKLAQSAQMYHYQHQKQQMLSLKHRDDAKIPESGATSDEENEDGDFTVYECPGLAPTGEMEVRNPLFDDFTLNLQRVPK
ncbi:neural proliferation differentiation and control protein 1 isoform X2 [Denticeps clupeoides]|uniref:neural proliferation differentiation and control protein 1 isoform X2 n=1 Tax=Denticeps clupeoides TaxID=299321 RepID=UPI0010A38141|nr:neural proliferation differentiation and control protein 1 isoform X2 [Denticeps clupeoides]